MVPEINFLPPSERVVKKKYTLLFVGAVAIIAVVLLILYIFSIKEEISYLEIQESAQISLKEGLTLQASSSEQNLEGTYESAVDYVKNVSYPVSPLMKELFSVLGKHPLRSLEMSNTQVIIFVEADSLSEMSALLVRLSESSYFEDVKIE